MESTSSSAASPFPDNPEAAVSLIGYYEVSLVEKDGFRQVLRSLLRLDTSRGLLNTFAPVDVLHLDHTPFQFPVNSDGDYRNCQSRISCTHVYKTPQYVKTAILACVAGLVQLCYGFLLSP